MKVIADGVETDEQLTFLRGLGCDPYQGFRCSPPVPADECEKMMSMVTGDIALSVGHDNTSDTIMIRALQKA